MIKLGGQVHCTWWAIKKGANLSLSVTLSKINAMHFNAVFTLRF